MAESESNSKPISAFLQGQDQAQDLKYVLSKVKYLQHIHEQVLTLIDAHIKNFCCVANLESNSLVIIAANGSIATHLRFLKFDLLQKFKNVPNLRKVQEIHIKVRPVNLDITRQNQENKYKTHRMHPLSSQTARIVSDAAKSIDDIKLKAIMERIANRTTR